MSSDTSIQTNNLYLYAKYCLDLCEPRDKIACIRRLVEANHAGKLTRETVAGPDRIIEPGRPENPELVHPGKVPRRSFDSSLGRVRLVHAIAHIEFNAINLALDAVYRFRDMPDQFYVDWLQVASEEAKHFALLDDYLHDNDSFYGAYAAHNGLWEMAVKTDHDVLVRMALVPRVLEARGLDVTPTMIKRLEQSADTELIDILTIIFEEEIGHVKIGSCWFNHCCQQRSLEPTETFIDLLNEYMKNGLSGPFEMDARTAAGFSEDELQKIVQLARA